MDATETRPLPTWLELALRARIWAPFCFLYFALLFTWAETAPGGLYESDGYFHARYAQLFPERGLTREFPWTQASTWRGNFCDKEFLYHMLLVPFCRNPIEPIKGAQILAVILALAVLVAQYYLLRLHHVPHPLLCTLIFASLSGAVLLRLGMIRSHVLSMLLFQVGLHLMLDKRWKALAALGFIYAWSYTFPWVLPLTAAIFALGHGVSRGEWRLRPPAAALAGVTVGSILHPYFPGTLENFLTYIQVIALSASGRVQSGVTLGNELYALTPGEFLRNFPLLTLLQTVGFAWALLRFKARLRPESIATMGVAWFWFAGCLLMPRLIEYAAPATALAAGFLLRDLLAGVNLRAAFTGPKRVPWLVGLAAAATILAGAHSSSVSTFVATVQDRPPRRFSGAAGWMKRHLEPGETIMNLWWDDFPELYYDAPEQHYLCGLDPTYMLRWNEVVTRRLEAMRARKRGLDGAWLLDSFGSRLLILRRPAADAYPELRGKGWKTLYEDEHAALFHYEGLAED
ncbi:MAG: hypothetical protein M5U26_15485 [Planctomycetota bacterium]|nr:hypothetical protein [Planctomycetota bacterium]